MIRRLLLITLFHAAFSTFGDIEANFLSVLSIPLDQLFNDSIQQNYGFTPSEDQLQTVHSFVASTLFIGILFGAILIGNFMDTAGRKMLGVYVRGILGISSSFLAICSSLFVSVELFAITHFLAGIQITLKIVLIIYLSECASDDCRGAVIIILSSGVAIMQLVFQPLFLAETFGNKNNWFIISIINLTMCITHLVISSFFPPSPKHLYLNLKQEERARQSIKFYQGRDAPIDQILAEYERERLMLDTDHMSWADIYKNKTTRLPFFCVIIVSTITACSAVALKSQYLQSILVNQMEMTQSDASFAILTLIFATSPFALIAPALIEKVGRSPLFLTMSGLCIFEWICLGNIAFYIGLMNMGPIVINEVCPFPIKRKATEYIQTLPVLIALITVLLYPLVTSVLGPVYHLTMVLINSVLFFLLYQNLPETKLKGVDTVVKQLNHYGAIDEQRPLAVANSN
ncbi:Solute carrier family 2, facilitated glucose transporter member 7 [Aphelenchoides bicaudatus]|nr:Solute carrier family 2, facilitated glucose transporter member 7 [Aphelenchoides bicaudatus]